MPLNIKDDTVHEQARKLAGLTGVSITAAVRDAVAGQLARVEQDRQRTIAAVSGEKLLQIARICADAIAKPGLSSDHSDLYDSNGMPK